MRFVLHSCINYFMDQPLSIYRTMTYPWLSHPLALFATVMHTLAGLNETNNCQGMTHICFEPIYLFVVNYKYAIVISRDYSFISPDIFGSVYRYDFFFNWSGWHWFLVYKVGRRLELNSGQQNNSGDNSTLDNKGTWGHNMQQYRIEKFVPVYSSKGRMINPASKYIPKPKNAQ